VIDGIYTAYMTGVAGQAMAMFVFREGKIGGADMAGLVFSGDYVLVEGRIRGRVTYRMPAQSISITGAEFETASGDITVNIDLPEELDPEETYGISTPVGKLNARFIKNIGFPDE